MSITDAKRKILDRLKVGGDATVGALAGELSLTSVAVRQHLLALEERGLVEQQTEKPDGRGRPAVIWSLSQLAQAIFPERHAELTVGLLDATRQAVGEDGLRKIIRARATAQAKSYRELVPQSASLKTRIEALARLRTGEGYMAEVRRDGKNTFLLIEHHCPICDAARCCQGLCGAELEVFQKALGPTVTVERTQHLLSGDQRCVYRIT